MRSETRRQDITGRILQRINGLSEPLPLAGTPWDFLRHSPRVRRYPGDAASLLTTLSGEYDPEDLVDANLAIRAESGELVPASALDCHPLEFQLLSKRMNTPPTDIVTARGCLRHPDPPCFAPGRDGQIAARLANVPHLFLAGNLRDVAILQRLGAAATLAVGLDSLSGAQLRRLWGRPESEAGLPPLALHRRAPVTEHSDLILILVGVDLAALRPGLPPTIRDFLERVLGELARFGFDPELLAVWAPDEAEVDDMRRAAEKRDFPLAVQAVRDSLNESLWEAWRYLGPDAAEPAPIADATDMKGATLGLRQEIGRARDEGVPLPSLKRAQERHTQLYEETVVLPLFDAAAASSDPLERIQFYRAAELAAELHAAGPLQRAAAVAGTRDDNPAADIPTRELLRRRREYAQELADLYKKMKS